MRVVYAAPPGAGWHPVTHMVRLLSEALGAELVPAPLGRAAAARRRALGPAPRRRSRRGEACLVVAAEPRHLLVLLELDYLLRGYEQVAGWVIDSFWLDRIPRALRRRRHFDRLFVTDAELVDVWADVTGVPVDWLPWGSDVLGLGSESADRPVDLQRLGRQPGQWDDDDEVRRACEALGLRFAGRPPMHPDAGANQAEVMRSLARAKLVLAFSNPASPAPYTHPTREYISGRWTDSLACGAAVAGIAPRCEAAERLLPPAGILELGTTDRQRGLEAIVAAAARWTPQTARDNHRWALERLDWRWRFRDLAAALGIRSERLEQELAAVERALLDAS